MVIEVTKGEIDNHPKIPQITFEKNWMHSSVARVIAFFLTAITGQ